MATAKAWAEPGDQPLSWTEQALRRTSFCVSGGSSPYSNYPRYYDNLERCNELSLLGKTLNVATGGPGDDEKNTVVKRDGEIQRDEKGVPVLEHVQPKGGNHAAATRAEIERLFLEESEKIQNSRPVMVYITDHGGSGEGPMNRTVSLWGEKMSAQEFRALFRKMRSELPEDSPLIMVNDQCYGGGMLESFWDGQELLGNACGFAVAETSEAAYDGGGFMRTASEMVRERQLASDELRILRFSDVHNRVKGPDVSHVASHPVSTSDLFLRKYYRNHRQSGSKDKPIFEINEKIEEKFRETLKPVMNQSLKRVRSEMEKQLRFAESTLKDRLRGDMTVNDLNAIVRELDEKVEQARVKRSEALRRVKQAALDWVKAEKFKTQDGALVHRSFVQTQEILERLRSKQDEDGLSNEEKARLKNLENRYSGLYWTMKGYYAAAKSGKSKAFQEFLKEHAPETDAYEVNVVERYDAAKTRRREITQEARSLRRLRQSVLNYEALKLMGKTEDEESLRRYLEVIRCENTPLAPIQLGSENENV